MIVIGNQDLEGRPIAIEGMDVKCPNCDGMHPLKFGTNEEGQKTSMLSSVKCTNGKSYLAGVGGVLLPPGTFKKRK